LDSITHGLLGLAIGALRRPDRDSGAVWVGCVLAAELPDLDYLWPASDPVLHALRAHRGLTHSILAAPVVALAAAALAKLLFRSARVAPLYVWSLVSTLFAHLLADAWTGWGTRLLLPISDERVTLDWMLVVDPFFTAPLLVGALWGIRQGRLIRKALLIGFAAAAVYLGARLVVKSALTARVSNAYPKAEAVLVFPSWLGPTAWRYVAVLPTRYAVGRISVFAPPEQQAAHVRASSARLSATARGSETVREALAWARFPIVRETSPAPGIAHVHVLDLRYHLDGKPTLGFAVQLDARSTVLKAELERGGSARELFERLRR
jgi:inner membrane protein